MALSSSFLLRRLLRGSSSFSSSSSLLQLKSPFSPNRHFSNFPSADISSGSSEASIDGTSSAASEKTTIDGGSSAGEAKFSLFSSEETSKANLPPLTTPKLFVSGLSRLTTDQKLKEAFSRFGHLLEAKVIVDRVSGRSKGFGFVTYASIEEAEGARKGMNASYLDGWVIFVDPAKPREPRPRPPPQSDPSETGFRTNKTIGWCG